MKFDNDHHKRSQVYKKTNIGIQIFKFLELVPCNPNQNKMLWTWYSILFLTFYILQILTDLTGSVKNLLLIKPKIARK